MRDKAALDDFVVELEDEGFFLLVPEFLDQRDEVGRVNLAGVQRHASGQIRNADDFHAFAVDDLVVDDAFDVAAGVNREIDDHAAGLHGVEHFRGHQNRRPASEDLRGGNDHIGIAAGFFHRVALLLDLLLGQRLRVALFGLAGFSNINLEKLRAERFHLFLDDGPRVIGE